MNYEEEPLHIVTPLLRSDALTKLAPASKGVYLKMENCQPGGSFKIRAFGRLTQKLKKDGCKSFIVPTTGNTGFAMAHASLLLGMQCIVYVPISTPEECVERLKLAGAEVKIIGTYFSDTWEIATEESKKAGITFVYPSGPEIWAEYETMVHELFAQLPSKPGVIVLSVGDGSLMIGILQGLRKVDSFNLSVKANKPVVLEKITSVAVCLGARSIAPNLLDLTRQFNVISEVVTDTEAVESCVRFVDDECSMVEPGCGAALAAVYSGLLTKLYNNGKLPQLASGPAVVIVCGGRCVSTRLLQSWSNQFNVAYPFPASKST
ncbi:L-serine dehydratase/L-threonine deaminase [Blattella germanica]|nr:L-serine dehydratase/L-threonine deaminase [Blattella germanica]